MTRGFGIGVLVGAILALGPALADEAGFTFKRVAPPGAGQKRITVQIAPGTPVVYPAPAEPLPRSPRTAPTAEPGDGAFDWFWNVVPPEGAAGFDTAVAALVQAPSDVLPLAPALASVAGIAEAHGIDILKATVGTQVSPALALAVISVESAGRKAAVSSAGAKGLMQLMPATAERFGVKDSMNAEENIQGGVAYLDWLLNEFEGDALLALAGYNAGENAVKKHGGVPPYDETRAYVPKVLAAWDVARALCRTRPELPSDGCVFTLTRAKDG